MTSMPRQMAIIAHNVRSTHNVGSLLRTAEGLGVDRVWLTGYTPYPLTPNDQRLPHLSQKISQQINKTALGAENTQSWRHSSDIAEVIKQLRADGYRIAALEHTPNAQPLPDFAPPPKLALIVGREVEGIEPEVLAQTDLQLEIPMAGQKESYNVVQAAAMAMYHCRFHP